MCGNGYDGIGMEAPPPSRDFVARHLPPLAGRKTNASIGRTRTKIPLFRPVFRHGFRRPFAFKTHGAKLFRAHPAGGFFDAPDNAPDSRGLGRRGAFGVRRQFFALLSPFLGRNGPESLPALAPNPL